MRALSNCILVGFTLVASNAHAEGRFNPHHLFIKMKSGEQLASSVHIQSAREVIDNIYLAQTSNLSALSAEMAALSTVEYVEKDYYADTNQKTKHEEIDPTGALKLKNLSSVRAMFNFNDPMARELWGFSARNGMNVTGAYDTLPLRVPKEIIVAVVDTGVDHTHEDLKDVMWTNPREIPGNKKDDDNNGYIDDIHGINTLVRDSRGRATMNTMNSGTGTGHYHGTHVAGTIAASQNNGVGIAGVASNVKIMAIRTVPDASDELDSDIVEAFAYAAKNGAKIINCSFGKKINEGGMVVRDTINAIAKRGVLVVASAGNDSSNNDIRRKYPASFDSENMMVVASTEFSGGLSYFSNFGASSVDIAAPGSDIISTMPGNQYDSLSGTSMASPNASGVAAMILGYFPDLKPIELKKLLMDTVTKVADFKGKMVSGGRINMKKALEKAAASR